MNFYDLSVCNLNKIRNLRAHKKNTPFYSLPHQMPCSHVDYPKGSMARSTNWWRKIYFILSTRFEATSPGYLTIDDKYLQ